MVCGPLRDVQFPASQFSSVVRPWRAELRARRVLFYVLANAGPCIPRAPRLRALVLLVLDLLCRLRALRAPALVPAALREGRASATFHVA